MRQPHIRWEDGIMCRPLIGQLTDRWNSLKYKKSPDGTFSTFTNLCLIYQRKVKISVTTQEKKVKGHRTQHKYGLSFLSFGDRKAACALNTLQT